MNDKPENLEWDQPFTVAQFVAVALLLRRDKHLPMDVLAILLRDSMPEYTDMTAAALAVMLLAKRFATLIAPATLVFIEPEPGSQQAEAFAYFDGISAKVAALKAAAHTKTQAAANALNN